MKRICKHFYKKRICSARTEKWIFQVKIGLFFLTRFLDVGKAFYMVALESFHME